MTDIYGGADASESKTSGASDCGLDRGSKAGETHPEPIDNVVYTKSEVKHIDYVLWSHGASKAVRARVVAELEGEKPPEWAIDVDTNDCKDASVNDASEASASEFEVWKVPQNPIEDDPWADIGIFPTGELMGVKSSYDAAMAHKKDLEESSPSEQFGESMEDAPYQFRVYERKVDADASEASGGEQ